LPEIFERVLQRPVRLAMPGAIAKMPSQLAEPEFATVIGLAMYAHRTTVAKISQDHGFGSRLRSLLARLGA